MTKSICTLFMACAFALAVHAQGIIPNPKKQTIKPGVFQLMNGTVLTYASPELKEAAILLRQQVQMYQGVSLVVQPEPALGAPYILLEQGRSKKHPERYHIEVSPDRVIIKGSDRAGLINGIASFVQMSTVRNEGLAEAHSVVIDDEPSFAWRGMHLDVCRHFFSKDEVKRYIDYLALYKMNVFHWHLTDDQGWRIEIKKYPRLTEVGGFRKQTIIGRQNDTASFDGIRYGGFYTQDEVREVVAYAASRNITVMPEIEMPGHALAALAAYPEYSCAGGSIEVGTQWGVFDDVYCPGKDSTFLFLQDILDEVCALFPSKYIHIGGDECVKTRWKRCTRCQSRMQAQGLKNEEELQSYFVQRIEKYLNSKGRNMIGWDEILEGGLAPNAAVMSWRGTKGGIDAAKMKHTVVMTPGKPCYFDHYQDRDRNKEPLAIGGYNPIDSVYTYHPLPSDLSKREQRYILGAQGNVWTEYMPYFKQVEYMALPRMAALSEVLWSSEKRKNYADFLVRLRYHVAMLDRLGANYSKHFLKTIDVK